MKTTRLIRLALAVGAGATLTLTSATPSPAAVTPTAAKAIDWLEGQMAANGHHLNSGFVDDNDQFQSFPDTGLTIDALLAIEAADRSDDAEAKETAAWVIDHASDYVGGASFGDADNSRYAGPLGKLLLFVKATGRAGDAFDGVNVEADLRGLMDPSGRFSDRSDFGDFSNGIGHAFDVLGLARTTNGVPSKAVEFLLLQQCPNGGFRQQLDATQCTDNTKSTLDATSFALLALRAVEANSAVSAAVKKGLDHLVAAQKPNASFADNANSTGLGASVLRAFGDAPKANRAASFAKTLQLANGANAGAILVDQDSYDAAAADGLDAQGKTLAARSTAQAVLALGLPAYPLIGAVDAVEPATTMALSASSVVQGGSVSVNGGGFAAGESVQVVVTSDPVTVGQAVANPSGGMSLTFTVPSSVAAGAHTVTLTGAASGVTIAAPLTVTAAQAAPTTSTTARAAAIVRTGADDTDAQAMIAGAFIVLGASLMLATRRRRIVYPFKK